MKLKVLRLKDNGKATLGALFIDDVFECWTLEDESREVKVKGETRIDEGTYTIKLRTVGGFHNRYSNKFDFHEGMFELQDVPNFQYVLIHVGNNQDDTSGCLLVGQECYSNNTVGQSVKAYKAMYQKVIKAFHDNEPVSITYIDAETKSI